MFLCVFLQIPKSPEATAKNNVPKEISYVFGGAYSPFLVKLIEQVRRFDFRSKHTNRHELFQDLKINSFSFIFVVANQNNKQATYLQQIISKGFAGNIEESLKILQIPADEYKGGSVRREYICNRIYRFFCHHLMLLIFFYWFCRRWKHCEAVTKCYEDSSRGFRGRLHSYGN